MDVIAVCYRVLCAPYFAPHILCSVAHTLRPNTLYPHTLRPILLQPHTMRPTTLCSTFFAPHLLRYHILRPKLHAP